MARKSESLKIGKVVMDSLYIHLLSLPLISEGLAILVQQSLELVPQAAGTNVYKIDAKHRCVSLLSYPGFFEEPFPVLAESWRVYLDEGRVAYRTYLESTNPPILHRKELLLPPDQPQYAQFAELTHQAEQLGLFENTSTIGFKCAWDELITKAGYRLEGHLFQNLGNDTSDYSDGNFESEAIERHRTALSRSGLSAPMQTLARNGLIRNEYSYFDYGCGRGDDLAALQSLQLNAQGWDPHYLPDGEKCPADIVNLGFVINVIEDLPERVAALQGAYQLANKLLVVSVMLNTNSTPAGKPFRDGYRTQRNTFQKYFSQGEIKEFVENILDTEAIPVAPGIVYVFRDKEAEQEYLFARQRNQHTLRLLGYRKAVQQRQRAPRINRTELLLREHEGLVEQLWALCLRLGRTPDAEESELSADAIAAFGSWNKAIRFVLAQHDVADLEFSQHSHRNDVLVYLALQLFAQRKKYKQLPQGLQRDIKYHFGDYQKASAQAAELFTKICSPVALNEACVAAAERGLGFYVDSDYLQLDANLVEQLPALLRIYIGCATAVYGDITNIDVIKLHIRSSKVSLMSYDDFYAKPLPRLLERIKIRLRTQQIEFYQYGDEFVPPLLYQKSQYINESAPHYEEQMAFDEQLLEMGLELDAGFGPTELELEAYLSFRRKEICGWELSRASSIPDLDQPCGANFTYRDFVECGETWQRLRVDNIPKQPETYNAMYDLATKVLDPVIDYFGAIKLTYGFAGPNLTKHIKARIAPKLDQHASHELNTRGNMICERGGAACDFIVDDTDMLEVVDWINKEIIFDRVYFYGQNRPIHASFSKTASCSIYAMDMNKNGHRMPVKYKKS